VAALRGRLRPCLAGLHESHIEQLPPKFLELATAKRLGEDVRGVVIGRNPLGRNEAALDELPNLEVTPLDVTSAAVGHVVVGESLGAGIVSEEVHGRLRRLARLLKQRSLSAAKYTTSSAASEAAIISASVDDSAIVGWRLDR
jgi:hypothetical protein